MIDVPPEAPVEPFDFFTDFFFAFALAGRFDDGCDELGVDGFGAEEVEVVEPVEPVDVVLDVVVVVDVVVDVEPENGQTSEIPSTFNPAGINDDNGVPRGTVNMSPPTTRTCKTHPDAAPAPGSHRPKPASVTPADTSPTRSFRLLNTVAYLLPPLACS